MRDALEPLQPEAIADAIVYAVGVPANINVGDLVVVPVARGRPEPPNSGAHLLQCALRAEAVSERTNSSS